MGEPVGILLGRSVELIVCELAVLKCGAAYVPIDVQWPEVRQAFVVRDSQTRLVLCDVSAAHHTVPGVEQIVVQDALAEEAPRSGNSARSVAVDGEASACVMYVPCSGGQLGGVVVPHRAISRLAVNNSDLHAGPSDCVAFAANPAADISTFEIWAPLLNGARVAVIDEKAQGDPQRFASALEAHGVTVLWLAAVAFNRFAACSAPTLGKLRCLIVGGDLLDTQAIARLLRAGGPGRLLRAYGPPEATAFSSIHEIKEIAAEAMSVPIGRPIANTRIHILDAHRQPVPPGVVGEICIGGAGLAQGYLNRPELTLQRFVADPFSDATGGRIYRTGELGRYRADGNIELIGPNEHQLRIRGCRVELEEIETHVRAHPGVRDAVVVARKYAAEGHRLVAYYTAAEADAGRVIGLEELRAQLTGKLPEYLLPGALVKLRSLPLTVSGRVDRDLLPEPEGGAPVHAYEAPRGELESALAQIWRELLQVEQVGRQDSFFELGGHSLLAVRLHDAIQTLGYTVAITSVFEHPVLAEFVAQLATEPRQGERTGDLVAFRTEGHDTPLFLIHQVEGSVAGLVHLAHHLERGFPIYGIDLKDPAHAASVQNLATHHIERIRIMRPAGPYRIAGYSYGGLVAYEIARQLLAESQSVTFLGLIDTYVPDALARDAGGSQGCVEPANPPCGGNGDDPQRLLIMRACMESLDRYQLQPIPVPVALFRAVGDGELQDASVGWRRALGSGIEAYPVEGTHIRMIQEPFVGNLAAMMSRVIRQSAGRPERRPCAWARTPETCLTY